VSKDKGKSTTNILLDRFIWKLLEPMSEFPIEDVNHLFETVKESLFVEQSVYKRSMRSEENKQHRPEYP
jgi:hypothetical protein